MKYRKKPVVIEAKLVTTFDDAASFVGPENLSYNMDGFQVWDRLHLSWVNFELGDWLIKGIQGEFYPCKPDVFDATYEPVGETGGDNG